MTMEIVLEDILILLVTLIVASFILLFLAFSNTLNNPNWKCPVDYKNFFPFNSGLYLWRKTAYFQIKDFALIDIVRKLKKTCPVGFGNKWRLLPLNSGLSRCWSKVVQFPGFEDSFNLCATACTVSCSSMYAFSLVADVTNIGEWEPLPSSQCLSTKPFSRKLTKDSFMLADQVVGIQRGTNVQSYIAMYRFMSFTEKTVKWILFWNVKKLEILFFLIQPAVSKTVDSQCVITHIFASKQPSSYTSPFIAQRIRNIKDFLLLSQLHVISSKYAAAIPAVPTLQLSKDLFKKRSSEHSNKTSGSSDKDEDDVNVQKVFMLVPVYRSYKDFCDISKGLRLVIKKVDVNAEPRSQQKKESSPKAVTKPQPNQMKLSRSVSDTCIKQTKNPQFSSNLELSSMSNKDILNISTNLKNKSAIVVEESFNIDLDHLKSASEEGENLQKDVELRTEKHKDSSNNSQLKTDEDTYVNLHIIHEEVSHGSLPSITESFDKSDLFCSSTSEFESFDPNQQFLDCKIADFLTQGNYGASELQAEMMLASQFDKRFNSEEQDSGGWTYHSTCKGITVLAKTTAGQFMKIISFLCQIELPVNHKDVWKCVKNPRFRFIADETVKTVKIVERISNSQKLIHVYHETNGFLKKENVDFCLLQTEREETNHFYTSYHSIEYEKCPFMTSVIRGSLRPSGWVVENIGSKLCKVTHMVQILISSPDSLYIQELSNLVPLAMHNLKHYTAARPK